MKSLKILFCIGIVAANASVLRDITNECLRSQGSLRPSFHNFESFSDLEPLALPPVDQSRPSTPNFQIVSQPAVLRSLTPRRGLSSKERIIHMRSISVLGCVFNAPIYPNSRTDDSLGFHVDHEINYLTLGLSDFEAKESKLTQKIADSFILKMLASKEVEKLLKAIDGLACHKVEDQSSKKKLEEFIHFHQNLLEIEKKKMKEANRQFEKATVEIDSLRRLMDKIGEEQTQYVENVVYQKFNNAKGYVPSILKGMIERRK